MAAKVGKQFQSAEQVGAELAVLVGDEWPQVKIKTLATRREDQILHTELADWLRKRQKTLNHREPENTEKTSASVTSVSPVVNFQFMSYCTNHCGALRKADSGARVTLCGWVVSRRDHGGVVFIDLRDRNGITQVVFRPEEHSDAGSAAHGLRGEDVIRISGVVVPRLAGTENPKLATGDIEVVADASPFLTRRMFCRFLWVRIRSVKICVSNTVIWTCGARRWCAISRCAPRLPRRPAITLIRRAFLKSKRPCSRKAPRGSARIPRAKPNISGEVLRAFAVPTTIQAIADGGRR